VALVTASRLPAASVPASRCDPASLLACRFVRLLARGSLASAAGAASALCCRCRILLTLPHLLTVQLLLTVPRLLPCCQVGGRFTAASSPRAPRAAWPSGPGARATSRPRGHRRLHGAGSFASITSRGSSPRAGISAASASLPSSTPPLITRSGFALETPATPWPRLTQGGRRRRTRSPPDLRAVGEAPHRHVVPWPRAW